MFAIKEAYTAGLLRFNNWGRNIIAGIIVGIVALPLAMAFAIATGVKPEQGLYTAIIAGVIVGIFGGSRVQIAGPTGAFIVILANITAHYGIDGLQVATLLAGFMLLLMGAVKLGNVIKFIPDPVIVGFTAGIGVIIFVGEWKDFFGLPVTLPLDMHFYQKCIVLIKALPQLNIATTGLASLSLVILLLTPYIRVIRRIPGPLIALIVATMLESIFHFAGVATLGSAFGGIPNNLPSFHFPSLSLSHILDLIGPAFTIALLGAIESLLSATAADGMAGTRHHSNQELIGQGIANIFAPLFGGFAATGAIARTATNVRSGGNSPIAAVVHSIFLVGVIVLLAPLASNIPLCTLAAILFVVAYNMSDVPHFTHMIKSAPSYDKIVLLAAFFLTIFVNLVVAVNVGVILAMLFFIRRMHQLVHVESQREEHLQPELKSNGLSVLPPNVLVYSIQGPFFFGVAEKIEHALLVTHEDPKIIIFRLHEVPFMDVTGLETFHEIISEYRKRNVKVYLCEANQRITHKLIKSQNILPLVEEQHIFEHLSEVLVRIS